MQVWMCLKNTFEDPYCPSPPDLACYVFNEEEKTFIYFGPNSYFRLVSWEKVQCFYSKFSFGCCLYQLKWMLLQLGDELKEDGQYIPSSLVVIVIKSTDRLLCDWSSQLASGWDLDATIFTMSLVKKKQLKKQGLCYHINFE